MAGALLGGSLIQFPLGWLSDRMDRRRVLLACAIGAAVVGILHGDCIQPRAPLAVSGLTILFGAMIYPMYALTVAHANDFAGPDEFVKIAGSLLLLLGFGTIVGPIVAALAMERYRAGGPVRLHRRRPRPGHRLRRLPHDAAGAARHRCCARLSAACRSPRRRRRKAPRSIRAAEPTPRSRPEIIADDLPQSEG